MVEQLNNTEIAIIGMNGRFPGAKNLSEFWANICAEKETISFFSNEELLNKGIDSLKIQDPNFVKAAANIADVADFDASFFGIHPHEAAIMDPQHRILLECAWEALENAGYACIDTETVVSVFMGAAVNTYLLCNLLANPKLFQSLDQLQVNIANAPDFLSTRISYKLNLNGPSITVQTACSTSLVAVHLACQSLLDEECDMALAGGISINLKQAAGYTYQPGGITSPDGHCRPFDAQAQGTIFGSGVGVVVLKRLNDALRDGDSIQAIIKGSAINNDGAAKVGYTAPSVEGQATLIAEAQILANVEAETISYIEAHGTGTALGDPIEVEALSKAFRLSTSRKQFCALGSVKGNIGHLDAASGIAGLLKTVLALQHRQLPASLHYQHASPAIDFAASPFSVTTHLTPWPAGPTPRRAGVSSFGIGGTNAHVILQEAPPPVPSGPSRAYQVLLLSARSTPALEQVTQALQEYLSTHTVPLADVAYTLQVGRKPFSQRRALVCEGTQDAVQALSTQRAERVWQREVEAKPRRIAFLFPGQGAQYVHMGQGLYEQEALFREQVEHCLHLVAPPLREELCQVLFPAAHQEAKAHELLRQTRLAQPALFIIEYALAQLLLAWGIEPQAMIGHSVGEYVAACLAGVMALPEALHLVVVRGDLMQRQPVGAMVAVELSEHAVQPLLANRHLALAAVNSPTSCVVAGSVADLEGLEAVLSARGSQWRRLETSHAFHSPMMEPVVDPFEQAVRQVTLQAPQRRYCSNVSGDWISEQQARDASYWGQHVCAPVRFSEAVATVMREGEWLFVEVGPGGGLSAQVRKQAGQAAITTLRQTHQGSKEQEHVLGALGQLWVQGVEADWSRFVQGEQRQRLPLPTYPFERQRFWIEPSSENEQRDIYLRGTNIGTDDAQLKERREGTPDMSVANPTKQAEPSRWSTILAILKTILASVTGLDEASIDPRLSLLELGVDSLLLLQVNQAVKDQFNITLTLRQFLEELTTLELLANHIDQQLPPEVSQPVPHPIHEENKIYLAQNHIGAHSDATSMPVMQTTDKREADVRDVSTHSFEPSPVGGVDASPSLEGLMDQHLQVMSQMLELMRQRGNVKIAPATLQQPISVRPTEHNDSLGLRSAPAERGDYIPYQAIRLDQAARTDMRQQEYLRTFIMKYNNRTSSSKRMIQQYREVLSNNRTSAGFRLSLKEIVYPIVVDTASGSKIIDIDGNQYIDISMGFGAYLFGHGPSFISSELMDEMTKGMPIGPFSRTAGEVARLIAKSTGVERVAFFNSGTEAVMVALRLARAVTGRAKIAIFAGSFHGAFDGTLARMHSGSQAARSVPLAPGIPEHMIDNVIVLDYGSPTSLEIIKAHSSELAAILVEPVQSRRPDFQPRDFLHDLRRITQQKGIALIFDEIITGFRVHPGGAQAWFEVTADIVTYGKVIGGGMPIGVIAGRAEYLDSIDGGTWSFGDDSYPKEEAKRTFVAGTFCQHPLAMRAALTILNHLSKHGPQLQQALNQRTAMLAETLNSYFLAEGAPITVVHFGSLFRFVLRGDLELFYYLLNYKGIYLWEGRNCFLSTAHSDEDIRRLIQAVKEAVTELQDGGFLSRPSNGHLPIATLPVLPMHMLSETNSTTSRVSAPLKESTVKESTAINMISPQSAPGKGKSLQFSLSYFGKYDADFRADKYDLLFESAKFADKNGFTALWVPERHFHSFGGLSPSPSILAAALARETQHIQIRAGSVVLPLHNPVLVAEEWAMIDNLSQGRIGISFASGWQVDDFVLSPQTYQNRRAVMIEGIELVHKLWRGQTLSLPGGAGNDVDIKLYPQPHQQNLPTWLTVVKNPETYRQAGRLGISVLTNLMDQSVDELAENITLYRQTLQEYGYPAEKGHVTLLLHTFLSADQTYSRETARQPFYEYIKSFLGLVRNQAKNQTMPIRVDDVASEDIEHLLSTAYARYLEMSALIGTPESCLHILKHLAHIGVDEIACFIDFGVDPSMVLKGLDSLVKLRQQYATSFQADASNHTSGEHKTIAYPATTEDNVLTVPLTPEQKQLWFLTQISAEASSAYNEGVLLQINGPLNKEALQYAIQEVVNRHEALRTTFSEDGENQRIWPSFMLELCSLDFSDGASNLKHNRLEEWLKNEGRCPFDLLNGPLLRASLIKLGDKEHFLTLLVHHIIADDWSRSILLHEVATIYSARCEGNTYSLGQVTPFREFIIWQNKQVESPEYKLNEDFWCKQFSTPVPACELPSDYLPAAQKMYAGACESLTIDTALYQELKRLSLSHGSTLFMALLAIFKIFLYRLTNQDDLVVGIPTASQPLMNVSYLVGQCINVLPARTKASSSDTFVVFLNKVKKTLLDLYDHQNYSLARLDQKSVEEDIFIPSIKILFNMDRALSMPDFADLSTQLHPYPLNFAKVDLNLNISEIDGHLQMNFEYATSLFAPETVKHWIGYFENLLRDMTKQVNVPLWKLPLMGDAERELRALTWNTPQKYPVSGQLVKQLFERQAERTPASLALVTAREEICYSELNQRANGLAYYLLEQGAISGATVGIFLDEPAALVISLLAILKLNSTYVLCPSSNKEDILRLLRESNQLVAVITSEDHKPTLQIENVHMIYLNATVLTCRSEENPDVALVREALFCIGNECDLFTGKNFTITHEAAGNHCLDIAEQLTLDEGVTCWLTRDLTTELVLSRILPCLIKGATLHWENSSEETTDYYSKLAKHTIDIIDISLYAWRRFLKRELPAQIVSFKIPRLVVVDGLQVLQSDISKWSETPLQAVDLLYGYRAKNFPLTLAFFRPVEHIHNANLLKRVSFTCLSSWRRFYILDNFQQLAAIGIVGHLFSSANALESLPVTSIANLAGGPYEQELFQTGDVARCLADGSFELYSFPMEPSGRESGDLAMSEAIVRPRTWLEEGLAQLWSATLNRNVQELSIDDSFFESGGNSLSATQLVARISEKFKVRLTLRTLFEASTIAELALHVTALLEKKDAQINENELLPMIVPDAMSRYEPFALTDVQQAYWIGRNGAFGLGNVATHAYYEVESDHLDIDRLGHAWNRLIIRHEMLRAIVLPDGQQCILQSVPYYQIEALDLRGETPDEATQKLQELRTRMSHQVLPSDQWPLFEIRATYLPNKHLRLFVSIDALIMDAWSMQILFSELTALYKDSMTSLETLELSFADYVRAQVAIEETEMYKRSMLYWKDRLATLPPAPDIPLIKEPATLMKPRFVRWSGRLEPGRWRHLKELATQAGLTPSIVLLAAYAEILTLWSKHPQFTINLTLFNRLPLHPQVDDIVGDFTSVTLLAIDNSLAKSFAALARQLQAQLWEDLDHRYMSGIRVLRELAHIQNVTSGVLMPVVFTSSLIHEASELTTSSMEWLGDVVYSVTQTPQVWLDHEVFEDAGALVFTWDVVEELFPPGLISTMFNAFEKILAVLSTNEAAWQHDWSLLRTQIFPPEQLLLRERVNTTVAPITKELLQTLFIRQATQAPEHVAVITARARLTYGELYERANRLGRKLRQMGAKPNTLIAVVMEKGHEQITGVLAILISGAAYVPIDPELPEERLKYILEHTQVEVLLTQSWLSERINGIAGIHCIAVDTEDLSMISNEPLEMVQQPNDLAYVIYTSGSTGQPKGVEIDHRGAVNTILDCNQRFCIGAQDRVLALSSLSFDLSVYDVFGLLASGGTIVLPDAWGLRDPAHWSELMVKNQVTIWNTVPALMDMLVTYANERTGIVPATLRLIMLSGDWISLTLPDRIKNLVPDAQVISLGGATEASIWSILYPIGEVDPDWKSIPYGQPMVNQTFHVLDHTLEPCPTWIPGQLYIGGIGLARGYWRDEHKTQASFIIHPHTGQRLYKTGDLGRYLPDGTIEFLGREDLQVKVQGYRIELGEIQTILDQHPAIGTSVVTVVGEKHEDKRIIAYIVPISMHRQEVTFDPSSLEMQISDPLERLKFKLRQLNLRRFTDREKFPLVVAARSDEHWEANYFQRRSYRKFLHEVISFKDFSAFLSCLAQLAVEGSPFPKYRYSSAGSLYPVQTYLFIQPDRIEGLAEGFYYYQPQENCLVLLTQAPLAHRSVYDLSNISTVEQAAFSMFFVGQTAAIQPLYAEDSRHFMMIEVGLMSQLLETNAPLNRIGLCQIGTLDFTSIRQHFALEAGSIFLHSLVGGPIDMQQARLSSFLADNQEYESLLQMLPDEERSVSVTQIIEKSKATLVQEVMASLKQKLPAYMIPSSILVMDALPLTSNGKVDRKSLSVPPSPLITEDDLYAAPETELHKMIVVLIQDILHREQVGIHDNFFDLGGNSVHLIQFHARLQKLVDKDIPIAEMFKHTTVNALALYLGQKQVKEEVDRSVVINEGKNRLKQMLKRSAEKSE